MKIDPNFARITLADLIARSAYQMGKTPLLPIFAASLGATDLLLGLIVSISTLTGMVTKPLFGILSDRSGRRLWLLLGTLFFAGVPFLYSYVRTPEQLIWIRLLHGTATAIYGPVTLAFVAERGGGRRAEQLGWFSMARSAGYIVGPALAGWMLGWLEPASVFTAIGLISSLALLPILGIEERVEQGPDAGVSHDDSRMPRPGLQHSFRRATKISVEALRSGLGTPAVWLSGGLEATTYIGTYALKAFLPLFALTAGYTPFQIGLFFSVQEAVHLVLKPAGGRFGDRRGRLNGIGLGLVLIGICISLLAYTKIFVGMLILAAVMGLAQALIVPCSVALIAEQIDRSHVAAGMGLAGTLQNGGKVAGPLIGGVLVAAVGYGGMLWILGVAQLIAGLALLGRKPGSHHSIFSKRKRRFARLSQTIGRVEPLSTDG